MITLLRGHVVALEADLVVIDTGGVGYEVVCHQRTVAELPGNGLPATLHIHTSVTDDAIRLYGFFTREELRLFRLLLTVERIGPRAALGILGRAELAVIVRALRSGDVALVCSVPGIGRKTAERLVLELRDKLDGVALPGEIVVAVAPGTENGALAAALSGLVGLGFREPEARVALAAVVADQSDTIDASRLVAAALRRLDTQVTA